MTQKAQSEFRDFVYLDTAKLHNFASVIQGGLATEVSDKIKALGELTGSLKFGIAEFGANIGGSKGSERERTQTMQITDPLLFDGVYQALKKRGLKTLSRITAEERKRLGVNDFVEIEVELNPPVVEAWIERLQLMIGLMGRYETLVKTKQPASAARPGRKANTQSATTSVLTQFEAITDLLIDYMNLSKRDPGKQYIRASNTQDTASTEQGSVWCGLLPEFTLVPSADLSARVTIVGQLEHILNKGDEWKLVDLTKFTDTQAASSLLNALNSLPIGVKPIKEEDFIAKHPDIFIRPLAIFR